MTPRARSLPTSRLAFKSFAALAILHVLCSIAGAHDIPNQRIDRSTQVTLRPGKLEIDYEVSLTELTLTQDLRRLIGSLPGGDRSDWLDRYGQVTGPLNAKGFLIHCDGLPVTLVVRSFELRVEEHPRYMFRFEAELAGEGRLIIHDTNYVSSEGTSRLALRGRDGIVVEGDELPTDVAEIPIRPVWQLSDEEEQRTRRVAVQFRSEPSRGAVPAERPDQVSTDTIPVQRKDPVPTPAVSRDGNPESSFYRLLDRRSGLSFLGVLLIAAGLGAAHSIQPGHGKSVVSAVALGAGSRWFQPVVLAIITTMAHTFSVLLIAAVLWLTRASQVAGLHRGLAGLAGFAIAAVGCWRIGRALRGAEDHADASICPTTLSAGGILGLGIASGLVPCWDAVGLVILSAALGEIGTGAILVIAFGVGMAAVLIAVGLVANRLRSAALSPKRRSRWLYRLNIASGLLMASAGLMLFLG